MTATRSAVGLPQTATVLPRMTGRQDADCQTATTYIGGSGSGSRPERLAFRFGRRQIGAIADGWGTHTLAALRVRPGVSLFGDADEFRRFSPHPPEAM
jgi:hypothetical protein